MNPFKRKSMIFPASYACRPIECLRMPDCMAINHDNNHFYVNSTFFLTSFPIVTIHYVLVFFSD